MRPLTAITEAGRLLSDTRPDLGHEGAPVIRGVVGTVTALGSTGFSLLAQIELWMRIASLAVGIAVGIATLISVVLSIRRGIKNQDHL